MTPIPDPPSIPDPSNDDRDDAVVDLLTRLVAIPSINPMGRAIALDDPLHREGRMGDFLADWLEARGIPYQRQEAQPGRPNLVARYDAPAARRTLLFEVHLDTVPVEGMTIDPFGGEQRDGRLYGRGACDVKGALAAMLLALARLARERPPGSASVILAMVSDEEFTHAGVSHLVTTGVVRDIDLAIVAEPTGFDLVNRHKGTARWRIRTRGVACHSSTPELGRNAVYAMAPVVMGLEAHARALRRPDLDLGGPTLSVGTIHGGVSVNVVPEECVIEIDRRLMPGESSREAIDAANCAVLETPGVDPTQTSFEPPWIVSPALEEHASWEWLGPLADSIERTLGRRPAVRGVAFGTDAGVLNQAGIPCVVLGPGDIAQAHTKEEWISLVQLCQAVEVYDRLARDLG